MTDSGYNESLLLSAKDAAEAFRITRQALSKWPVKPIVRGGKRLYHLPDLIEYATREDREKVLGPVDSARARKLEIEGELAELELRKQRGELIEVSVVAGVLRSELQVLRAKLLAMPNKGASLTFGLPTLPQHLKVWQGQVDELMAELTADDRFASRAIPDTGDSGLDQADLDAAAEADGISVG